MPRNVSKLVKTLAHRIRQLRRAKGLTVEAAANRYGCSRRWWVSLEQGQNVSIDTLSRIAKVLGVPLKSLLEQGGD